MKIEENIKIKYLDDNKNKIKIKLILTNNIEIKIKLDFNNKEYIKKFESHDFNSLEFFDDLSSKEIYNHLKDNLSSKNIQIKQENENDDSLLNFIFSIRTEFDKENFIFFVKSKNDKPIINNLENKINNDTNNNEIINKVNKENTRKEEKREKEENKENKEHKENDEKEVNKESVRKEENKVKENEEVKENQENSLENSNEYNNKQKEFEKLFKNYDFDVDYKNYDNYDYDYDEDDKCYTSRLKKINNLKNNLTEKEKIEIIKNNYLHRRVFCYLCQEYTYINKFYKSSDNINCQILIKYYCSERHEAHSCTLIDFLFQCCKCGIYEGKITQSYRDGRRMKLTNDELISIKKEFKKMQDKIPRKNKLIKIEYYKQYLILII